MTRKRSSTGRHADPRHESPVTGPPASTPLATVGIGASAGGLDAFTRLLGHLPASTGLAYVLVQHLDPDHTSILPELLSRSTSMPIVHATDGVRVEADHAYVIPPNTTMTVADGHLRLVPRKGPGPHLPVDAFLTSLARVHGSGSVGVILSGSGSDGTRGIASIKEAGGITMVQDSGSAQYASMPQHAIDTGAADFILPPEDIARQLTRLAAHLARNPAEVAAEEVGLPEGEEEEMRRILALLHKRTGVDFQHYRRATVNRRVLRRMLVHRQETRSEYLAHVRLDPSELDALYEDLLIGVTSFFRDPAVFEALKTTGFPGLMKARPPNAPIRIWVAGCSGGEETYSLAITLLELLGDAALSMPIQIFGTDLSEASIATARAGFYPATIAAHVSAERLARFFVSEASGYRIRKSVRDLCVFSRHNIVRDPPFSHLDLISCRNVMIYLSSALQRRVLPVFHYALEPHGLLILGSAESVGPASDLFVPISKRHRIYRVHDEGVRSLEIEARTASPPGRAPTRRRLSRSTPLVATPEDIEAEADRLVLARFAPPGVVLNEHMEIVHFRGDTSRYLTHSPGLASLQLLRLARAELGPPLRAALRESALRGHTVHEGGILVQDADAMRRVSIDVLPFRSALAGIRFFVVLFREEETAAPAPAEPAELAGTETLRARRPRGERQESAKLRQEVATTRRYLQDLVEQHEAATEELRAANEEIQSSNEELQSTNEELETTKEEIQSTNEELSTLNEELSHRNRELAALSSDLTNVLTSTTIPIVIVGRDLGLRRFTPAAGKVMKVVPTDAGRSLSDVRLRFTLPELEGMIQRAIDTLAVTDTEVQDDDGHWWALTVRPYRTIDRHVDGAVLVFADIDAAKRLAVLSQEAAETRGRLLVVAEEGRALADTARRLAEEANAAKGTFLASISHDLRTPLNAIAGYTELLEMGLRGPITDMQLADLTRIKRSSRHLLSMINDILNFAKLESGTLQFELEDFRVASVVEELEDLFSSQVEAKGVGFDIGGMDAMVRADREKLRQILVNLLTNAIKFTNQGGRIGIECRSTGANTRIDVWDTGIGIAPDQLESIFEPFVQVNRGLTTPSPDGIGLGLAISRDLARGMHGNLTAESTVGRGSRFILILPGADTPESRPLALIR